MVRRPRYNTTKSCWTRTRPVRCVVFPWCSAVGFTETGLQKAIWARQISVLRKLGNTDRAVEELSRFVDTFYTDVEAWLELADLYASQHQYVHTRYYLSLSWFLHTDTEPPDIPRLCRLCRTSWCSHHKTHSMCYRLGKRRTQLRTSRWP